MSDKLYTPFEAAILILKKSETLCKAAMGGLKPTTIAPVPGVVSPLNSNTGSPNKVGSQAVVKSPKAKKLGSATDKPSVFFGSLGKSEENQQVKHKTVKALQEFLIKQKGKKKP